MSKKYPFFTQRSVSALVAIRGSLDCFEFECVTHFGFIVFAKDKLLFLAIIITVKNYKYI